MIRMVQWRSVTTSQLLWATETLAGRDTVPPGFDYTPGSSADTPPIEIFEHRRFLSVELSIKEVDHTGEEYPGRWHY